MLIVHEINLFCLVDTENRIRRDSGNYLGGAFPWYMENGNIWYGLGYIWVFLLSPSINNFCKSNNLGQCIASEMKLFGPIVCKDKVCFILFKSDIEWGPHKQQCMEGT